MIIILYIYENADQRLKLFSLKLTQNSRIHIWYNKIQIVICKLFAVVLYPLYSKKKKKLSKQNKINTQFIHFNFAIQKKKDRISSVEDVDDNSSL